MQTITDIKINLTNHAHARGWAAPLTVFFYIIFLHAHSYDGDILAWFSWAEQLVAGGYASVQANYPPLLLHWFWLIGKIFNYLGLEFPPKSDVILKYYLLLPVLAVQIWLSLRVEYYLLKRNIEPLTSPIFWGVVASPAMLLDGPVWGQVDILPFIPLWLCLSCTVQKKFFFAGIAFAVAIMLKFQAIVLVPVLAGLLLKDWKNTPMVLAGILLAGIVGFLPFIVHGKLFAQMAAAYWGNMSLYPYATFNAANLWYALLGNMTEMHVSVFGQTSGILSVFTPHKIGLGIFAAISSLVMFRAWRYKNSHAELVQLCLVLILAFFAFAPSMHERYLFLLVPFTALASARGYISGVWFAAATLLVSLNILLVLPFEGEFLWTALSWISVLAAGAALIQFGFKRDLRLPDISHLAMPVTIGMVIIYGAAQLYQLYLLKVVEFDEQGRCYLSDISEKYYYQSWGLPRRDTNVTKGTISIYGHAFDKGLGVHATSSLVYQIPEGAKYFHAYYGLDDKGREGQVKFVVELDGREVWSSLVLNYNKAREVLIPLGAAREIRLNVNDMGEESFDHANWAEASFWLERPESGAY